MLAITTETTKPESLTPDEWELIKRSYQCIVNANTFITVLKSKVTVVKQLVMCTELQIDIDEVMNTFENHIKHF